MRLQNVMNMLEIQQDETRKLKGTLDAVRKLIGGEVTLPDERPLEAASEQEESKSIIRPPSIPSPLNGVMTVAVPRSQDLGSSSPSSFSLPDRTRQTNPGFPRKLPTWQAVNNALERAVIGLQQQESRVSPANDTDVAIRAVLDGWTAAKTFRSLDLGWLILKQVDQHVFCDCSPATRLAILRAMRLNMLVSSLSRLSLSKVGLT